MYLNGWFWNGNIFSKITILPDKFWPVLRLFSQICNNLNDILLRIHLSGCFHHNSRKVFVWLYNKHCVSEHNLFENITLVNMNVNVHLGFTNFCMCFVYIVIDAIFCLTLSLSLCLSLSGTKKREGYLEWPEYFMAVAFLSAQRSKDPSSQVVSSFLDSSAVIVVGIFCPCTHTLLLL